MFEFITIIGFIVTICLFVYAFISKDYFQVFDVCANLFPEAFGLF